LAVKVTMLLLLALLLSLYLTFDHHDVVRGSDDGLNTAGHPLARGLPECKQEAKRKGTAIRA
jgi:hypothetical protein